MTQTQILMKSLFSQRDMALEMDPKVRPPFAGGLLLAMSMMQDLAEGQELREKWILDGIEYGYPRCCVLSFINGMPEYAKNNPGPWAGSGFVPCAECQPEARKDFIKFVQERILPFRRAKQPFLCRIIEDAPLVVVAHTEKVLREA